jgi:hypothetical protein
VSYVRNAMYALRVGVSNPVCAGSLRIELRYGRDQTSAAEQFKSNKRISPCGSLHPLKNKEAFPRCACSASCLCGSALVPSSTPRSRLHVICLSQPHPHPRSLPTPLRQRPRFAMAWQLRGVARRHSTVPSGSKSFSITATCLSRLM